MAVYTQVSSEDANALMQNLNLGSLTALQPCSGGIENTNYFASTPKGHYVLTIFERLTHEQLPFYLYLMQHLANAGIPVPNPVPNTRGHILHTLYHKPCAVVNKLNGASQLQPQIVHCQKVGHMLAKMHLAGRSYTHKQPNLRGLQWCNETVPTVLPFITEEQKNLLLSELAYQNHISKTHDYQALPRGPIHADLFRDNVLFDDEQLCGFFDFYFAGTDTWLFDLAVTLNDWCIDHATGLTKFELHTSLLQAYEQVRPLTPQEQPLLKAMLRAGALRFWLSRLWDYYLPRQASLLTAHDPTHFERVLRQRIT